MKEKENVVKLVFGCLDDVVSTTQTIHLNIMERVAGDKQSGFGEGGKRKRIYDTIKTVSGKIEGLVLEFMK
ncbi:MAG TPA: hypothetical protein PLT45_00810 [Smithella sp.]|nr:hypothetical protein [Smithella sp.]